MGISLKDQRRKKRSRRSYADYKPPRQTRGPRNDPFRIVFYLVVIVGAVWVYLNQDQILAEITQQTNEVSEAVASSRPTPTPDDSQSQNFELEALAAFEQGRLVEAADLYRQAAELDPARIDYYVQRSRFLLFASALQYGDQRQQTLDDALESANVAVLNAPENPAGYAIMGKVYDWQGRPDQASSTILRAIDIDESYGLAHSYLAEAFVDLDRWDQALETIQLALEMEPENADVRRDYAYVLETLGDYAAAVTQYEAAIALQPRLAFLRVALARAYRVNGQYNEALDQLFEAQTIEPSNPVVAFEIGRTYETYIGDPNEALEYYQNATDLDPEYPSPWLRIGTLRYFLGRYTDAILAFERALELNTESNDLYYQLGLSYAYDGQCDVATRYLEEARGRAGEDERILDAVATGYEVCSQPTLDPAAINLTPTAQP